MRTTIENRKNLSYDLSLKGVVICDKKTDTAPISTFYDFGVEHGASFIGYSDKEKSTFVESLFRKYE